VLFESLSKSRWCPFETNNRQQNKIPLQWSIEQIPYCRMETSAITDQKKVQNTTVKKIMLPVFGIHKGQYQNIITREAQQALVLTVMQCCVKSWGQQLQADNEHYCQRCFIVAWQCTSTYCHPNRWNPQATALWGVGSTPSV
jgi:hypothetical protein